MCHILKVCHRLYKSPIFYIFYLQLSLPVLRTQQSILYQRIYQFTRLIKKQHPRLLPNLVELGQYKMVYTTEILKSYL